MSFIRLWLRIRVVYTYLKPPMASEPVSVDIISPGMACQVRAANPAVIFYSGLISSTCCELVKYSFDRTTLHEIILLYGYWYLIITALTQLHYLAFISITDHRARTEIIRPVFSWGLGCAVGSVWLVCFRWRNWLGVVSEIGPILRLPGWLLLV